MPYTLVLSSKSTQRGGPPRSRTSGAGPPEPDFRSRTSGAGPPGAGLPEPGGGGSSRGEAGRDPIRDPAQAPHRGGDLTAIIPSFFY
jgi:hypothetical protein